MIDYLKTPYQAAKLAAYYRYVAETNPGPLMRDALIRGLDVPPPKATGIASDDESQPLAA